MSVFLVAFLITGPSLVAGTLGGIIGTGSSLLLLPCLSLLYGSAQAIPIMAIAAVFANLGRVMAWWQEIDWRAFCFYSLGSLPGAVVGANLLVNLPAGYADSILGGFFLLLVPLRRKWQRRGKTVASRFLPFWGLALGVLTGLVQSTGPLSVMLFSFHGLSKGVLLGTEALTSLVVYSAKTSTFSLLGTLTLELWLKGIWVGLSLMLGAFIGKRLIRSMEQVRLVNFLDIFTTISGGLLLWQGYQGH